MREQYELLTRDQLIDLVVEITRAFELLKQAFALFRRQMLGRRSERLDLTEHPQLPYQDLAALPEVETEIKAVTVHRKTRRLTGRGKLPAELPRKRRVLELRPEDRVCVGCQTEMTRIGEEVAEQLDYVPSSMRVLETVRPKLACPRCQDQVITTPLPPAAVPKCLATPSLLAHVVTSKYADHLPLNRLEGIFSRHGVTLSRKTMCDWVGRVAGALEPLYATAKEILLGSSLIRADDTSVQALDRKLKQTRTAHLWDYLAGNGKLVVFDYTADWKAEGPVRFLKGFAGNLQADAYKGWDVVARTCPGLQLVGCWAHARRKFHEAKLTDMTRATSALLLIRELYAIEEQARDLAADARTELRRTRAGPLLEKLREWMVGQRLSVLPKSPMAVAFTYLDNQWRELTRYVEDGNLPIDNNDTERVLRSVAVGRANWLFVGNDEGGRRAAILYTMVMSCKLNRVDPYAWLYDVLTRLPELDPRAPELLPHLWTPTTDIARERRREPIEEVVSVALRAAA